MKLQRELNKAWVGETSQEEREREIKGKIIKKEKRKKKKVISSNNQ